MAETATLFSFRIDLADQDRNHYDQHKLKVALHPSETPVRMVARVLAWCLFASEELQFGRGLSHTQEPAILHPTLDDRYHLWLDMGEPEPARLKKAGSLSERVAVIGYTSSAGIWWQKNKSALEQIRNLSIDLLPPQPLEQLANNLARQVHWQVMISEHVFFVTDQDNNMVELPLTVLKEAA